MQMIREKARNLRADRLISITAVNAGKDTELYYHFSFNDRKKIRQLKLRVPATDIVESLSPVFANAEVFEAEIEELYGVKFRGNPLGGAYLFRPVGKTGICRFPLRKSSSGK